MRFAGNSIRRGVGKTIIMIVLVLVAFVQLYPLLWMVLFSFKSNPEINRRREVALDGQPLAQILIRLISQQTLRHHFSDGGFSG